MYTAQEIENIERMSAKLMEIYIHANNDQDLEQRLAKFGFQKESLDPVIYHIIRANHLYHLNDVLERLRIFSGEIKTAELQFEEYKIRGGKIPELI